MYSFIVTVKAFIILKHIFICLSHRYIIRKICVALDKSFFFFFFAKFEVRMLVFIDLHLIILYGGASFLDIKRRVGRIKCTCF